MKHIVSFSGGIGSYMAAKRVVEEHGKENTLLVFTDTKIEDEDLYRFIDDAVKDLGAEYLYLADGRTVWEVFFDEKYMGNSRFGNCTKTLKQVVFREWIEENYKPDECIVYLGMDWSEEHRYTRAIPHWQPYTVKAPMCDEPFLSKSDMFDVLKDKGIEIPRLYKLGMSHNNCGGFCVKAGHGHFKNLLEKMPERYAYHEAKEQEFRTTFEKDVSIMKREKVVGYEEIENEDGTKTKKAIRETFPLTMKELREEVEGEEKQLELDFEDIGGCGCYPY